MRLPSRSTLALAAAGALASTGTAYLGARNLLVVQASQARTVIPKAWDIPPRADGVYTPGGGPVQRWQRGMPVDLHLMIFGDSTATGYGCMSAEEVPGVLIARGLADQTGKRIRLSTKAIVGATSKGVSGQVDAMFVAGPPPDVAVMMIGANDITALNGIIPSARRLGQNGDDVAHPWCGGGRRHLPGSGRHHSHPATASLAGSRQDVPVGPCPGRRRALGRRHTGAAGESAGSPIPGHTGADVLRRRLSPVTGRIRTGSGPAAGRRVRRIRPRGAQPGTQPGSSVRRTRPRCSEYAFERHGTAVAAPGTQFGCPVVVPTNGQRLDLSRTCRVRLRGFHLVVRRARTHLQGI